jgi:DNA-binding beta-propeller fold protein YncE
MRAILLSLLLAGCAAALPDQPTKRIEFAATGTYPEGIVFDSVANIYYVSSARLGTIGKVTPDGQYTTLKEDSGFKSSYGIKVHPDGKKVYACVGDANYSKFTSPDTRMKMARVVVLDAATGNIINDIDLSQLVQGKHFPNDLTFDTNGNAYVTDSYANVIYKIDTAGRASVFADSPIFKTEGIGLNGIAWHRDGYLLAASSGTGCLYKISISNPSNVSKIAVSQFFMNADGILLDGAKKLILVQNGGSDKIYELTTDDNWQNAKVTAATLVTDRFTYPSTVTKANGKFWVMNAKFTELNDSVSVPSEKFAIQHARLMPLPKY